MCEHNNEANSRTVENTFQCDICEYKVSNKTALKQHVTKTHRNSPVPRPEVLRNTDMNDSIQLSEDRVEEEKVEEEIDASFIEIEEGVVAALVTEGVTPILPLHADDVRVVDVTVVKEVAAGESQTVMVTSQCNTCNICKDIFEEEH